MKVKLKPSKIEISSGDILVDTVIVKSENIVLGEV